MENSWQSKASRCASALLRAQSSEPRTPMSCDSKYRPEQNSERLLGAGAAAFEGAVGLTRSQNHAGKSCCPAHESGISPFNSHSCCHPNPDTSHQNLSTPGWHLQEEPPCECFCFSLLLWLRELTEEAGSEGERCQKRPGPGDEDAKRGWVPSCHPGCAAGSVHRRDPATERHGSFDLLRSRPGPVHPSLGDLVTPGSPGATISVPALARTPARHSRLQPRTPGLSDPPASASPELGLQAQATVPGCSSLLPLLPITPGPAPPPASGAPRCCRSTVGGAAGTGWEN